MNKIKETVEHKKKETVFALMLIVVFGIFSKSIIMCLFLLIPIVDILSNYFKDKKYVSNLSDNCKQDLNKELESTLLTNNEWYLTEKYIFITEPNIMTIRYDDIILMYYKLHLSPSRFNSRFYQQVIIVLNNGQKYKFTVESNNNEDFIKCAGIISAKNKNILIEKTKENLKILNQKYGLKLK